MEQGTYLQKHRIVEKMRNIMTKYDENLKRLIGLIILIVVASMIYISISTEIEPSINIEKSYQYADTITVCAEQDYAPYSFLDKDGVPQGYDVELMYMLAEEMKVNVDLKLIPWTRELEDVDTSDFDIILGLEYTDTAAEAYNLSHPVQMNEYIAFGTETLDYTSQLHTKKIGIVHGSIVEELFVIPSHLQENTTYYSTYEEGFHGVLDGDIDYLIGRYSVGKSVLVSEGLRQIAPTGQILANNTFCFGVSKDQPELLVELNNAIDTLNYSGKMQEITDKWLGHYIHITSWKEFVEKHPIGLVAFFGAILIVIVFLFLKRREEHYKIRHEQLTKAIAEDVENLQNDLVQQDTINRQQRDFLNNVSHELKTPLTILQGLVYGVDDGVYQLQDKYVMHTLHIQIDLMENLVAQLLGIARFNLTDNLIFSPFLLADVVSKVNYNTKYLVEKNNLQLTMDLDESVVIGARDKIELVISNLYSNAIHYTPEGETIAVTVREGVFVIKNTGVTIAGEDIPKIWEPFCKISSARARGYKKTGLGLYIVKKILERHKAVYSIESDSNSVTATFTLEIKT